VSEQFDNATINVWDVLGEAVKERFIAYEVLIRHGKLNADDVRRLEGMNK